VRILFDQGTPVPLRQSLTHHEVTTAYERDWSRLKNGELLDTAEKRGFEVLVTTDSNLKFQQKLKSRRIAIVVLSTPSWPRIQRAVAAVVGAVDAASKGSYTVVEIP
jgi:predicted nuclease of predicted toxin-antitoxin system